MEDGVRGFRRQGGLRCIRPPQSQSGTNNFYNHQCALMDHNILMHCTVACQSTKKQQKGVLRWCSILVFFSSFVTMSLGLFRDSQLLKFYPVPWHHLPLIQLLLTANPGRSFSNISGLLCRIWKFCYKIRRISNLRHKHANFNLILAKFTVW